MNFHKLGQNVCTEIAGVIAAADEASIDRLVLAITDAPRVFVSGAGRSGWVARCLAMRLMHLGRAVHVVGDATAARIRPGDLLLACTGSGETPAVLGHVDAARRAAGTVAVITACPDSTAAKEADLMIHLPAPTPKALGSSQSQSVQPMGTLFEQSLLIFGDVLVMLLADRLGQSPNQMWQRHTNLE
jgi:6-phospho-3-hexuloisomerase